MQDFLLDVAVRKGSTEAKTRDTSLPVQSRGSQSVNQIHTITVRITHYSYDREGGKAVLFTSIREIRYDGRRCSILRRRLRGLIPIYTHQDGGQILSPILFHQPST